MIAVGLRLRSAGAGRASWQRGRGPRSSNGGGPGAGAGARPAARRPGPDSRRATPRPRHSLRADINITPLVDVVLVLLIIFMVVTPMLSKGVNVDLPITQHHDKRGDDNRDIVVAITHLGQIYVGSTPVSLDRLAGAVTEERRHHPDKAIFLKGDTRIDYGQARRVMEALHRVGVEQIQLGTEEEASSR